jgi:hypothetical protein
MDIVFGDCLSLGNYRYALVLVDVATRYCWLYGMQALTSNEIISCLVQFQVAAGGMAKTVLSDFDQKLIELKSLHKLKLFMQSSIKKQGSCWSTASC